MMLDHALALIEAGYAVFPLIPNSKRPMTKNGFKDATKSREAVKQWWTENPTANIGLATGEVSGLVVVDIDVKKGAKGMESLESLTGMTPTLTVRTPSGGLHF
ncbi:MAG TPA: bifunctional DNA primase/polymerase, partial [Elusimicrobiales bacterium]|nr:bifunctional DNA primase/polymerase [Elusimicrobiales bacterium]